MRGLYVLKLRDAAEKIKTSTNGKTPCVFPTSYVGRFHANMSVLTKWSIYAI